MSQINSNSTDKVPISSLIKSPDGSEDYPFNPDIHYLIEEWINKNITSYEFLNDGEKFVHTFSYNNTYHTLIFSINEYETYNINLDGIEYEEFEYGEKKLSIEEFEELKYMGKEPNPDVKTRLIQRVLMTYPIKRIFANIILYNEYL